MKHVLLMSFLTLSCAVYGQQAVPTPWESPCLVFTKGTLPEIRRRLQETENGKVFWNKLKKDADTALQKDIVYPPRGGQWSHWYTCKKCGANLKTQSPTEHVCVNCKAVYSGWPYDDVPLMGKHMNLANTALNLGMVYQITQDKTYADKAREILLGYAERYLKYPLHNVKGKPIDNAYHIGPQSLNEAGWLTVIAQAFDCIQPMLSQQDIEIMADKMMIPAAELILQRHKSIHNISCFHCSAIGLTGLALKNQKFIQAAIFGKYGFLNQIAKGVTDDGMWYERAWGYHFFTIKGITPLVIAIRNTGVTAIPERYKLMFDAPLQFVTPAYQLPAFHDSGRNSFKFDNQSRLYELPYALWHDPVHGALVKVGKHETMEGVFYGEQNFESQNASVFTSRDYTAAGIAVLRTQSAVCPKQIQPSNYIAMDYGEHGGSHGHPDKLNFILCGHNTLISEDPGSIKYGNPAHQGWYKQTLSHNTLVVDSKSQAAATGKSLDFITLDNGAASLAEAGAIYPGVTAHRAIALIGDVVLDLLWADSDTDHLFELPFHARGELSCDAKAVPVDVPEGRACQWATDWKRHEQAAIQHLCWQQESVKLDMTFLSPSADAEFMTAIGRGNPTTVKPPFMLSRTRGKSAVFASVFQILQPEAKAVPVTLSVTRNDNALSLHAELKDGRSYELAVSKDYKLMVVSK